MREHLIPLQRLSRFLCLAAVGGVLAALCQPAGAVVAGEYLAEATRATGTITLPGDQSAARREVAMTQVKLDARAALEMVATIARPTDAARALAAAALGMVEFDDAQSEEALTTAGRLLTRISDPTRRESEQRLLLTELSSLGEKALPAAPELGKEDAESRILLAAARRGDPKVLSLMEKWSVSGAVADRVLSMTAVSLAATEPDRALEVAGRITSETVLAHTLWAIAEQRPPFEAVAIAGRVSDPVVRSAILSSAARRSVATDPEAALAAARAVPVSPASALAQVAVSLAPQDAERALEVVRELPPPARSWAAGRIAVIWAPADPARAEVLLAEIPVSADAYRMALVRMAPHDPDRAARLARAVADREDREAALAAVAGAIAKARPKLAVDLIWDLTSPWWRSRGAAAVAREIAAADREGALALLGLVETKEAAQRVRADIAVRIAESDPETAERLLSSLPATSYRRDRAFEAAESLLRAGHKLDQVMPLAALVDKPDLSLRWLLPDLVWSQRESPLHAADRITDPYLRALALVHAARRLLSVEPRCRPASARLGMVRPVVHWEGR